MHREKISGIGGARHQDIALGVQSDSVGLVNSSTTQIGGVNQRPNCRCNFGYKGIVEPFQLGLAGPFERKIGGTCPAGDINIALRIYRNAFGKILIGTAALGK